MGQWFVLQNEEVSGPFSDEDLKQRVADGRVAPSAMVWGQPQPEWINASGWVKELPQLQKVARPEPQRRRWHYARKGASHGPMEREQLVAALKDMKSISGVVIWTKGMKAWAPIYEFHDLLDEVGVNRRQHPRANISGRVAIKKDNDSFIGKLETISEGGFGVTGIEGLKTGDVVSAELQSEALYVSIIVKATVRYMTEKGFIGFKFDTINMESKANVIQYVKSQAMTTLFKLQKAA